MGNQKTTLELRIELAAKEAQASVISLNADTVRLAQTFKDMNLGTTASQAAMKKLETFTASAAKQMQVFGASSSDVRKAQAAIQSTVRKLIDDGIDPESESIKKLAAEYRKLGDQSKELDDVNNSNLEGFKKLKDGIAASAAAVALVKVIGKAREFGSFALESADTFQKARNEFGTLLGDMEAGAGLFDRIKEFNDFTPFNLDTTKQGVNVLLSAEVPLSDLITKLTMFGDLSQGNSQKFTSFINAFAKGAAKGAVDMEVLNVYGDQGIQILAELAKSYDTTKAGVIKMASEGKVSFEDFSAALERLTAEGGLYYGGMALGAKDLSAMQEGLTESVTGLAASYGSMFLPVAKAVYGILTNITNAINDSPILKGLLAAAITGLVSALVIATVKTIAHAVAKWSEFSAIMAVNSALSVTQIALGIAIAATMIAVTASTAYAASQQKAASATAATSLRMQEQTQYAKETAAAINKCRDAYNGMSDAQLNNALAAAQWSYAQSMADSSRYRSQGNTSMAKELMQQANAAKANIDSIMLIFTNRKESFIDDLYKDTLDAKLKSLQDQLTKAKGYLGDPSTTQAQKDKISAIIVKLQQEIADASKKAKITVSLGTDWQDKNLSGLEALNREQEKSVESLNKKAQDVYRNNYETQADYIAELAALNDYYDSKRMGELKKAHDLRIQRIKEEMEYQALLARQQITDGNTSVSSYVNYTAATVKNEGASALGNTDVGEFMTSFKESGNWIIAVIDTVVNAIMNNLDSLETFDVLVNGVSEAIKELMVIIGPFLDQTARPTQDLVNSLARLLATVVMPALKVIGPVLTLITNLLNMFVIGITFVIQALNFFGNLMTFGLMGKLASSITDINNWFSDLSDSSAELTKSLEKAKDDINDLYDAKIDAVESLLDAQIDSLKKKLELGLIGYDEYVAQATSYNESAGDTIDALDEERNKMLEDIEEQLADQSNSMVTSLFADDLADSLISGFIEGIGDVIEKYHIDDIASLLTGGFSSLLTGGKGGVKGGIINVLTGGIGGIIGGMFDEGTPSVPRDMIAQIHKEEIITPKTFSQGIRSGDLALVGPGFGSKLSGDTYISVSLTVEGSVTSEKNLIKTVHEGVCKGIKAGELDALPA